MRFSELMSCLKGFSFRCATNPRRGKALYDFILETKPSECLELGFGHGTSSCYMAAALDELGAGHLTSVDLAAASEWQDPAIEDLLAATGLGDYVTVAREGTSYTWFLKKKIEERSSNHVCEPIYDFCFIDGGKNWTVDGCAFFLVDKLLRPAGWILFDDLMWTYQRKKERAGPGQEVPITAIAEAVDNANLAHMTDDELQSPHIELVFRLLVMQHPDYSEFLIQDETWAWAQKIRSGKKTLVIDETTTLRTQFMRAIRRLRRVGRRAISS